MSSDKEYDSTSQNSRYSQNEDYDAEIVLRATQFDGRHHSDLHAAAINGNKIMLQKLLQPGSEQLEKLDKGDQFGRTPLVFSVLGDRVDCAEMLLKAGAKIDVADVDGRTALHWAAHQGNYRSLKLLINKGANIMAQDNEGRTPVFQATSHQNTKSLSFMIKKLGKPELNHQDCDQMTALHWCASYGKLDNTKILLKAGASTVIHDNEGKTPLHWTANNSDSSVAKALIDFGADINDIDSEGRTTLHLAVADGNEAIVKALTSFGKCNVSLPDRMFRTPLHWAAVLGHATISRNLLQRNADYTASDRNGATALHYAAQSDFPETVSTFVSFDHVKDIPDNDGRTALMWAASKGNTEVLKIMLLHDDSYVNLVDKTGGTALHAAAFSGESECVRLLIKHSADVNYADNRSHTPIFRACETGHLEAMNTLIDGGGKINLKDNEGRTLLHWAALGGHDEVCSTLLQYSLEVNQGDNNNRSPIHVAAYNGHATCIKILLDNNADPNKRDVKGVSPLHWASSFGHIEAVKTLLDYNANPNFTEYGGEKLTPLDYAIMDERLDTAQYLIEHGALTITSIQDLSATTIQAFYRGYRVRKNIKEQRRLMQAHERLKSDTKKRDQYHTDESATQQPDGDARPKFIGIVDDAVNTDELLAPHVLVTPLTESQLVARRERHRIYHIKSRVRAVTIIQRAWRRYIKDKANNMFYRKTEEADELRRQMAALTIQLAWRKYLRTKYQSITKKKQKVVQTWDPKIITNRQKKKIVDTYNSSVQVSNYMPDAQASSRPEYLKYVPSPAVVSYNFAVYQYHPFYSRKGNARARVVLSNSTRVRVNNDNSDAKSDKSSVKSKQPSISGKSGQYSATKLKKKSISSK
ncbi:Inversin [Trichoplax sp. H2]|nr:Inversin [Trichoplax sp. H2]|eukprot:RDD37644.1 Inversin [Trichoplax sp. H2]